MQREECMRKFLANVNANAEVRWLNCRINVLAQYINSRHCGVLLGTI